MKTLQFTRKNVIRAVWFLYAAFCLLLCLPQFDHLLSKDLDHVSHYFPLNDGWEVTVDDRTYHDVSLEDFHFQNIGNDAQIMMQRTLPDDFGMMEPVLRMHIRHTAVEIFIDGESVFSYGLDRMLAGKSVGSGFQFVNFPKEYAGKSIQIRFYPSEKKVFTKLDPIRIYEWENVYRALMTENRIPFFFGNFLVIFGIATTCVTVFALAFSTKFLRLLCVSLFASCMGLWTICYYKTIQVFSIPLYSVSFLEYLGLYIAPISLFLYIREDVAKLHRKWISGLYHFLMGALLVCVPVMFLLHGLDIVHLPVTLKYMQLLIICCLLYFITIVLMSLIKNKDLGKMSRIFLVGMLIIGACVGYDLAAYLLNRYVGSTVLSLKGLTSVGIMIFIFILFASFYMDLTKKMMQENERNYLIKSAYTDELTQLHNRRFCVEYMRKLETEKVTDYAIFCFDVNNLKTMNDTFGHTVGDVLIKNAAAVIAETFGENGIVARVGGDEFVAVLGHCSAQQASILEQRFHNKLNWKNKETSGEPISIACGYATAPEATALKTAAKKELSDGTAIPQTDIERIYQLADDRMYENKKAIKAAATPLP